MAMSPTAALAAQFPSSSSSFSSCKSLCVICACTRVIYFVRAWTAIFRFFFCWLRLHFVLVYRNFVESEVAREKVFIFIFLLCEASSVMFFETFTSVRIHNSSDLLDLREIQDLLLFGASMFGQPTAIYGDEVCSSKKLWWSICIRLFFLIVLVILE